MPDERITICYRLTVARGEDAQEKARNIALEQTVELPATLVPAGAAPMTGRIDALERQGPRHWQARISFPLACIGGELTQFLNVLFGNISLQHGIRIEDIHWPAALLDALGGPGQGIAGLRRLTGVGERPLLATALKPMGLDPHALATVCEAFALGGIDIIKDDHGLADQPAAPFAERVPRCQEAVVAANARSGGSALYFPNVTAAWPELSRRAELAVAVGCRGVLISPWLAGLTSIQWLRDHYGLAVMAHPALSGGWLHPGHGIGAELLLGDLPRVAGADAVIYPNAGGRFRFSRALCERINRRLRRPLGGIAPAFPTPGGGIDAARAAEWASRYGSDTIFLVGTSLYARGDLTTAARELRHAVGG